MRFDWGPEKRAENLRKHGIDFVVAIGIFDGPILERHDDRFDYDEIRMAAIGVVNDIDIVVYYTDRGAVRRVFSARKATKHERKAYYQALYP